MSEHFNALGEQAKLIDMASKYTSGDIDKARDMVSGQFEDIVIVKVKFYADAINVSGLLFAFFNLEEDYI